MAITKLFRLKQAKNGNPAQHLKNSLKYIFNPDKTENCRYVGGTAGLTWERAYHSMIVNKQCWNKTDMTQGFHYVLSFPPDSKVTPDMADTIAAEFCERLLGEDFYYAYAVHNDKAHIHAHIIFDSVSRIDGHKYHSPRGDWERKVQPITDELCKEHGLPVLSFGEERVGTTYAQWQRDKTENRDGKNAYTWYDIIRDDIDEAVQRSGTYEEFLKVLQSEHYQIWDGKYLSLKPYGRRKSVRSRSLGDGYGKEQIRFRIEQPVHREKLEQDFKVYGDVREIRAIIFMKHKRAGGWHMSGYQKLFYRRWRNTCFIRRPDMKKVWVRKKDVTDLYKISAHIKYLLEHDIESAEDLGIRREQIENERKALDTRSRALKTKLYYDPVNKLVNKYLKLTERLGEGEELPEEAKQLKEKIEERMEFSAALERRQEIYEERKQCLAVLKGMRAELRLMDELDEIYRQAAREEEERLSALSQQSEQDYAQSELQPGGQTEEERKETVDKWKRTR